jgi:hypothetical protein
MTVHGSLYQAERQYFDSAHAEERRQCARGQQHGTAPPTPPTTVPDPPLTILVLAANPLDTERLRLDAEVRALDAALRQGAAGMRWTLRQQWAVRSGDLVDALLRFRPGHCPLCRARRGDGSLIVEDFAGLSRARAPRRVCCAACRRARRARASCSTRAGRMRRRRRCCRTWIASSAWRGSDRQPQRSTLPRASIAWLAAGEAVATAVALGRAQVTLETGSPEQARLAQLRVRDGVDAAGIIQVGAMAATPRVSTLG